MVAQLEVWKQQLRNTTEKMTWVDEAKTEELRAMNNILSGSAVKVEKAAEFAANCMCVQVLLHGGNDSKKKVMDTRVYCHNVLQVPVTNLHEVVAAKMEQNNGGNVVKPPTKGANDLSLGDGVTQDEKAPVALKKVGGGGLKKGKV